MLLSFFTDHTDGIIDNIISGIIVGILGAIGSALIGFFICRILKKKRFYKAFCKAQPIQAHGIEENHFFHYVKHTFRWINSPSYDEKEKAVEMSYRSVVKKIKESNANIIILVGSAGIGKSLLMKRLALTFSQKPAEPSLDGYGIFFRTLNGQANLDKFIDEFEKMQATSRYSLFFDGLDELSDLSECSGSELLDKLLSKLDKDISQKCDKIFISLRPEILERGYSNRLRSVEDGVLFFQINNFNVKQIMRMYHREKRSCKDQKTTASLKQRRKNRKTLKLITRNNPDSVFSYPLILTWADDILSAYSFEELKTISWYDALGEVVKRELKREFKIYCKKYNILESDSNYSCIEDEFFNEGVNVLKKVGLTMALSNKRRIEEKDIPNSYIVKKNGEKIIPTRRLLRYVEWSEREALPQPNGERLSSYEFLHNTIYWRVLAEALLDPNILQADRAKIILAHAKGGSATPLLQYCCEGLWSLYGKENVFFRLDNQDYLKTVRYNKRIACNFVDEVHLEVLLSCFYGFNEVSIGSSIRFDFVKIQEFVEERKLNLFNANIKDLTVLNQFSNNSFDFLDCSYSHVEKAVIPDYVKNLSFFNCTSLKNVTIPDGVTNIDDKAFAGCRSLMNVVIPDSVTDIGSSAFEGCSSLTSVVIPDGVTDIGDGVFEDCGSLTSVVIPDSVKNIRINAFKNTGYYNHAENWENDVLYIGSHLIGAKSTLSGEYKIKTGTLTIAGGAFKDCSSLTSVVIPDGVTYIQGGAFKNCSSLMSVVIPDNVKSIERSAFENTGYYNHAENWENGVLYIGSHLIGAKSTLSGEYKIKTGTLTIVNSSFLECRSLTSIIIPDSVKSIGANAFYGCTSLNTITIPNSVTRIEASAFMGCISLTNITIPNSVTRIGAGAFAGCISLNTITIPNSVTRIGASAFGGCTSLTNITFPKGADYISRGICFNCISLKAVIIPEGVTRIEPSAFYGCTSLTTITIPNSVTSIGMGAFYNCTSMTNITFPKGVDYIDELDRVTIMLEQLSHRSKAFEIVCTDGIVKNE